MRAAKGSLAKAEEDDAAPADSSGDALTRVFAAWLKCSAAALVECIGLNVETEELPGSTSQVRKAR